MKKKILLVTLITLSLFIFSGCKDNKTETKSKEKISLEDKTFGYKTTFEYDKEDGFEFDKEETGGKYAEILFNNTNENLEFDAYYTESTKATSDSIKASRKEKKYFKEYKFGKYSAYSYNDYDDDLYLVITIDEKDNYSKEIFVSIEKIDYKKEGIVFEMFDNKVIQNFFKSIKVTVE